ncbi:DUF6790 family protein [Modestobacter altitudinis]|uniref:DUF6790 family protein n=1 Tax=Modestobacter altitudinis TaxID=2213158 RepID=UPI00110CE6DD|nr:DUF6790 family protein [Modestobacter altitudinis]
MVSLFPPALFVLACVLGLLGVDPPGKATDPGLDDTLLLWTLYLSIGWAGIGAGLAHTAFARSTAASIGWESNGFQYEVGFADLATGVAAIYAVHAGSEDAWVAIAIAGGLFRVLAGVNHIRGIVKEKNYAPGNSLILVANFGPPVVLLVTLLATGIL